MNATHEVRLGTKIMPNTLKRHYDAGWSIASGDGTFILNRDAEIRIRSGHQNYAVQNATLTLEIPSRRITVNGAACWPFDDLEDDVGMCTTQLYARFKKAGLDLGELKHYIVPCRAFYKDSNVTVNVSEKSPTYAALYAERQYRKGYLSQPDILSSKYSLNLVRCDTFEIMLIPIDRIPS